MQKLEKTTERRNGSTATESIAAPLVMLGAVAILVGSTGCSSMRGFGGKFRSHEKVDLMPFAEQTIAILSGTEYPLAQDNSVLIREFLGEDMPGVAELDAALAESDRITDSIKIYSIELMKISRMEGDEDVRTKALAKVVRTLEAPIRKKLDLTDEMFAQKLEEIAAKPDFLAGVRAVQPLIDSAGLYYSTLLNSAEKHAKFVAQSIDAAIDDKYAALLEFGKVLEARKRAVLEGLALVHHYRRGDKAALKTLRAGEYILDAAAMPSAAGTPAELATAEAHFLERLTVMQTLYASVEKETDLYRRTHHELDEQYAFVREGLGAARLKFVVWSQAHEKMASGMKDSAEWFDIADAPGMLIKAGAKVLK
jgi:hypothetical protein